MIKNILLIGLGGFIGSVARYFVSLLNLSVSILSIPVGTLVVNVAGSFILGFLTGIAEKSTIITAGWRMFLMVGLCGGFTTFSTFTNENLMLLHNGEIFTMLSYTALSIILGFAAVFTGFSLTNLL